MKATRITKVKLPKADAKLLIEYEETMVGCETWDEHALKSDDAPLPSLKEAFAALAQDVEELCELPDGEAAEGRIEVTGASFSYGGAGKDVMGAVLTAKRTLKKANSPLNLVTPHKAAEPYGEGDGDPTPLLSDGCVMRLRKLQSEAERYLSGDRLQGDLFAQGKTEEAPAELHAQG